MENLLEGYFYYSSFTGGKFPWGRLGEGGIFPLAIFLGAYFQEESFLGAFSQRAFFLGAFLQTPERGNEFLEIFEMSFFYAFNRDSEYHILSYVYAFSLINRRNNVVFSFNLYIRFKCFHFQFQNLWTKNNAFFWWCMFLFVSLELCILVMFKLNGIFASIMETIKFQHLRRSTF